MSQKLFDKIPPQSIDKNQRFSEIFSFSWVDTKISDSTKPRSYKKGLAAFYIILMSAAEREWSSFTKSILHVLIPSELRKKIDDGIDFLFQDGFLKKTGHRHGAHQVYKVNDKFIITARNRGLDAPKEGGIKASGW